MQYSHRDDPARLATLTIKDPEGILVVETQPAGGGKAKRKTFNKKKTAMPVPNAWNAAMGHLFDQGFMARAPQDGPVQWVMRTDDRYPHGFPFALSPDGAFVWVADTDALRRIRRGSLEQEDVSIDDGTMGRNVAVATDGTAWGVVDVKGGHALVRVTPALEVTEVARVAHGNPVSVSLSLTADGRALGPHPDGAGLYAPDGTVERTVTTHRCKHWSPRAAISPSGAWLASLTEARALRLDGPGGEQVLPVDISQLLHLAVDDDGVCLVAGIIGDWGLFRVTPDGAVEQLAEDHDARVATEDTVVEVLYGMVTERRFDTQEVRTLAVPGLNMSRRGRALVTPEGTWIVRTDTHVLAEIDPSRIQMTP